MPTRMGGPGAPDNLRLGHLTQEWLATSDEPASLVAREYVNPAVVGICDASHGSASAV